MDKKHILARTIDKANSFGFALIIGSVIYYIIGSVAGLVGGTMLDWTFCGTVHHALGYNGCSLHSNTGWEPFDYFTHRLINITLPWFLIFWGFVIVGLSSLGLKLLGVEAPSFDSPLKKKKP